MAKPVRIKINVKLIDKTALFHAKSGAVYLDVVAWENRNGPGQYGDTHYLVQSYKEGEGPEKPPIIGNMTVPEAQPEYRNEGTAPKPPAKPAKAPEPRDEEDEIPF